MTSSVSVSKGVFVYKNGFSYSKSHSKIKRTKENSVFSHHLWYQAFKTLWHRVESKLHVISSDMFSNTLKDLVNFVQNCCDEKVDEIPTAALLTGVNMPDHEIQFTTLTKVIKENVTPHCVTLSSQDCTNLKLLVENMINGFVNDTDQVENLYEDEDDPKVIKKAQCTFSLLQVWYENLYMSNSILNYSNSENSKKNQVHTLTRRALVVIIPDLENFNEFVIQDFLLIAHSYINILPFVLIFGVATSIDSLHRSLPYKVSSKTNIKVFSSQSSVSYLNNILENVLFSENCPFSLGGKVFNLFTDIFLFYDFSVTGFIKNFKFAMTEHFSKGNMNALCCTEDATETLQHFSHEDFESLRRIPSFRDLVENEKSYKKRIKLVTNDEYLREVVTEKITVLKQYKFNFHIFLRCLNILVKDLPKTLLGKQIRELYAYATSKNILKSHDFKECFQLLNFQSRDEFSKKLRTIRGIVENNSSKQKHLVNICEKLDEFLAQLKSLKTESMEKTNCEGKTMDNAISRKDLKEKLVKLSNDSKNDYEKLREKILNYLNSIFETYLYQYTSLSFHEIFFFDDSTVQNQLVGTQRSSVHAALNDPQSYLQCTCCKIQNDSVILPTMPDICIAYKLHLECGKMINLYDWLQSFISILDPDVDENEKGKIKVDPKLQARFSQAVVELEYLGFVKSSKRKTDHVQRLTWGG